jgi:diaminopimelate epimerase
MKITIEKYHSLGNDYLVFDPNKNQLNLNSENVAILCNRHTGLGSDGVLEGPFIEGEEGQMSLKIWNPDGSIAKASGNGVSIFGKYLKDKGYAQKKKHSLLTDGGHVEITYLSDDGNRLKVSMGKVSFWSDEIPVIGERRQVINEEMVFGKSMYPVTCVSVGNPHCVIPMRSISKELVCKIGQIAEEVKYFPETINTEIMKVVDRNNIIIESFERGAGYTMATGTGACAAAAVAYRLGLTCNKVIVGMPGGNLQIELEEDWSVYMIGDVFYIAKITLSSELAEKLRMV